MKMKGDVNTLNAVSYTEEWRSGFPDIYQSIVTVVIKSRLSIGNEEPSIVSLAATNQSNLLCFVQGKLIKNGQLPFKDCKKLDVYRSCQLDTCKEYVVASSSDRAAVIALSDLQVVKEWESVKCVEVRDHFNIGQPQIIINFWYSEEPVVVTEESEWEATKIESKEGGTEGTPLQGVIQALEVQLKNSQKNLLDIEHQTSLRRCLLNRSLATLKENLKCQSLSTHVPTFLIPVTTIADAPTLPLEPVKIAPVSPWQIVVGQSWIVGTVFSHSYQRSLFDIECVFSSSATNCHYQIHYHLFDDSQTLSVSNAGHAFLSTNNEFNSQLEPNRLLAIIVTTTIPDFKDDVQCATGNIFLACKLKTENDPQIIQAHLGSVSLTFQQFFSRSCELKMNSRDTTTLRRNLLSMSALLEVKEDVTITTNISSASQTFLKMMEELQLSDLSPLPCYYGLGIFGHVVLAVRTDTLRRLSVKIRAESPRHYNWFIQSLKSVLPDDAAIAKSRKLPDPLDTGRLERRISLALSLLESCQTDCDVQVMETNEPAPYSNATAVEQIRSEFLRRQSSVLDPARQVAGIFKIPPKSYEKWQRTENSQY